MQMQTYGVLPFAIGSCYQLFRECEVQVLPSFVGRVRCVISTMPFEAEKAVAASFEKLNNRCHADD